MSHKMGKGGESFRIMISKGGMCFRRVFLCCLPMESNSLKCSSIQMIHPIELKFGMYIIGHRSNSCIDFGE